MRLFRPLASPAVRPRTGPFGRRASAAIVVLVPALAATPASARAQTRPSETPTPLPPDTLALPPRPPMTGPGARGGGRSVDAYLDSAYNAPMPGSLWSGAGRPPRAGGAPAQPGRTSGGAGLTVLQPLGAFRAGARPGVGGQATLAVAAARTGPLAALALRLDGALQTAGTATVRTGPTDQTLVLQTPLSQTTRRRVGTFGLGPELTIPAGPVRPYAYATFGAANLATTTSVAYAALNGAAQQFTSTDLSSWAPVYGAGGGLRVALGGPGAAGRSGGYGAFLDLGARGQVAHNIRYLPYGSLPAGTDPLTVERRGDLHFAVYTIGLTVGAR